MMFFLMLGSIQPYQSSSVVVDHDLARFGFGSVCQVKLADVRPVIPYILVNHSFDQFGRRVLIEISMGGGVMIMSGRQGVVCKRELKLVGIEAHIVNGVHLSQEFKVTGKVVRYIDHVAHVAHLFSG